MMAINTDENHATRFSLSLDSGLKLGCDVPSTNPPIHLWVGVEKIKALSILNITSP